MPLPTQDFFNPIPLDVMVKESMFFSNRLFRMQVVGHGEFTPPGKGKPVQRFVVVRAPVGDGTFYRFPLVLPKGMPVADTLTITKRNEEGVRLRMEVNQKKNPRLVMSPLLPGGESAMWTESLVFHYVCKQWKLEAVDGQPYTTT